MRQSSSGRALALTLVLALGACGDDPSPTSDGNGASGAAGGNDGVGNGGGRHGGAAAGAGGGGYVPTPSDVGFSPASPVPAGEQILFNDWSFPDQVKSMAPDGSAATTIFSIHRVWSMAVSRAGDRIAIACGDPEQEAHYGLNLGDAIQHTWLYDVASEKSRRSPTATSTTSAITSALTTSTSTSAAATTSSTLLQIRQPSRDTASGESICRLRATTSRGSSPRGTTTPSARRSSARRCSSSASQSRGPAKHRSIEKLALPTGSPELVLDLAYRPQLSPDGTKLLYADATQGSALFVTDLAGESPMMVTDVTGTSATWSPDGSRIAYLSWDDAAVCSHVEVVASDGSEATTPTRIRDCAATGENITQLAWFVRR